MSYKELWSLSFTPSDSKDSLCFEWGDMLLIEQLQEFIKYLSKANNRDMRENLLELEWYEFRKFLHEPGKDRFGMSEHLKSVISTQRNFSGPNSESDLGTESTKESPIITPSAEELKVDSVSSQTSSLSKAEDNSISTPSTQSPLVPKKLFDSKENLSSFSTL